MKREFQTGQEDSLPLIQDMELSRIMYQSLSDSVPLLNCHRALLCAGEGSGPDVLFEEAGQKISGSVSSHDRCILVLMQSRSIVGSVSSDLTDDVKSKVLEVAKANGIEVPGLS